MKKKTEKPKPAEEKPVEKREKRHAEDERYQPTTDNQKMTTERKDDANRESKKYISPSLLHDCYNETNVYQVTR